MSDNLPAVRPPANEVSTVDTDSWTLVVADVSRLASHIADTEFVPKGLRGSAPATAAAMLYGREVGLPPMTALNMTHVVEGKPGLSAEGMRALVLAAGHDIEFTETTGAVCRMRARRRGAERWTELAWTIDMARAAELTGKSNWKKYPRALLQARCTTELCRMVFPDVIHGFRSVEELEDMRGEEGDTQPVAQIAAPATKVTRKRTTTRGSKGTPAPAEPRSEPAGPVGPPLPGEPGFEDLTPAKDGEGVGSGDGATSDEVVAGEDSEDPTSSPDSAQEASQEPDGDVVDAEVVPEATEDPAEPAEPADEEEPAPPRAASRAQHRMLMAQFNKLGVNPDDREERLLITSKIVNRPVSSSTDLTAAEASKLSDTLATVRDYNSLAALLDEIDKVNGEQP